MNVITRTRVQAGLAKAALVSLVVAPALAFAQSDPAVAAIEAAQAKALLVAGALLAMGVAVWGALYLYRKFFK